MKKIILFIVLNVFIKNSISYKILPTTTSIDEVDNGLETTTQIFYSDSVNAVTTVRVVEPEEMERIEDFKENGLVGTTVLTITEEEDDLQFDQETKSRASCGIGTVKHIINGTTAHEGEFPWMAALVKKGYIAFPKVFCGASIISNRFLLTAAHCIKDKYKLEEIEVWIRTRYVIADIHRKDNRTMKLQPVRFIPHEDFKFKNVQDDIGLIELSEPLDFKQLRISPVCLPSTGLNSYAGSRAVVTGWGFTHPYGHGSHILRKVIVPILEQGDCRGKYPNKIGDGMLCAGYDAGNYDSCINDSGGPLMINGTIVGLVSWGEKCATPNKPGVYTRVGNYLDWIKEHTNYR